MELFSGPKRAQKPEQDEAALTVAHISCGSSHSAAVLREAEPAARKLRPSLFTTITLYVHRERDGADLGAWRGRPARARRGGGAPEAHSCVHTHGGPCDCSLLWG